MDEGVGDADFLDTAVGRVNTGSTQCPQTAASLPAGQLAETAV